ncbi:MAG: ribbon-helix-helix domain-containing protein [Candidatus Accumulibacter sp.]|nr:ribbon-helix-helix domain-containing protein [Accumulibacter sp.]
MSNYGFPVQKIRVGWIEAETRPANQYKFHAIPLPGIRSPWQSLALKCINTDVFKHGTGDTMNGVRWNIEEAARAYLPEHTVKLTQAENADIGEPEAMNPINEAGQWTRKISPHRYPKTPHASAN